MMNICKQIEAQVKEAFEKAGIPKEYSPMVHPASRPEFGDYQADGVMNAARQLRTNPRDLAAKVLDVLDLENVAETVDVAGPGFLNITLRGEFIVQSVMDAAQNEPFCVDAVSHPETIVVDYSGPNLAKEMHVGHLRSTIIGDALARIYELKGHRVIRQNHVGDYGTQFGMLIAFMDEAEDEAGVSSTLSLSDLESFYREAKKKCDEDPAFSEKARTYVVQLQQDDEHCIKQWRSYVDISMQHCQDVYGRLTLSLTPDHVRAESSYKEEFPKILSELAAKNLLVESEGAQCVFLDEFKGRNDTPLPFIVQKSDGAYLYSTFDLAALKYRCSQLHADKILYVHDSRQGLHFKQAFAVSRAAGFAAEQTVLEHIAFGTMLGTDGKPFKTRDGGTVKLIALLDEAETRAYRMVDSKNPDLSESQKHEIARAVGIGAVKYADLAMNRTTDYIFSWDKMLSLNGNTAPYIQYAYSRIMSIFRKAGRNPEGAEAQLCLEEPAEKALALKLLQMDETIDVVCASCGPHILCNWLYDVTVAFMKFYERCPVLSADKDVMESRLSLCAFTAAVIKESLGLLGIQTVNQM